MRKVDAIDLTTLLTCIHVVAKQYIDLAEKNSKQPVEYGAEMLISKAAKMRGFANKLLELCLDEGDYHELISELKPKLEATIKQSKAAVEKEYKKRSKDDL